MRLILPLVFCLILSFYCLEVSAFKCLCGAKGTDMCSCSAGRIVRPKFLTRIEESAPLEPIGDTCSCGNHIVQPAVPPRPCIHKKLGLKCKHDHNHGHHDHHDHHDHHQHHDHHHHHGQHHHHCEHTIRAPEEYQGPTVHANTVYETKSKKVHTLPLPADAVSLSLAYRLGRPRIGVSEDKLQYGFRTAPVNGKIQELQANIPEEKLWSVDRAIIELKEKHHHHHTEEDEEEPEAEPEPEHEPHEPHHGPAYLTYGEIGYSPEKPNAGQFAVQSGGSVPISTPSGGGCQDPLPPINPGKCGFKPGSVISYQDGEENYRMDEDDSSCGDSS